MVARILMHGGQVRVSREGVDVLDAAEADLILSIQARPAQMVLIGRTFVAADSSVEVFYGMTLLALPIVIFQTSNGNDSQSIIPYNKNGYAGNGPKAAIIRALDRMTLLNLDSDSRWMNYRVIRGTW